MNEGPPKLSDDTVRDAAQTLLKNGYEDKSLRASAANFRDALIKEGVKILQLKNPTFIVTDEKTELEAAKAAIGKRREEAQTQAQVEHEERMRLGID